MEYLFVYGLFRDSARPLLGKFINCGRSCIRGKLYKVNEFYPDIESSNGLVFGDVYLINSEIFSNLDQFEGEEYIRKKTKTDNDIECWVYVYKHDVSKFKEIKSGD